MNSSISTVILLCSVVSILAFQANLGTNEEDEGDNTTKVEALQGEPPEDDITPSGRQRGRKTTKATSTKKPKSTDKATSTDEPTSETAISPKGPTYGTADDEGLRTVTDFSKEKDRSIQKSPLEEVREEMPQNDDKLATQVFRKDCQNYPWVVIRKTIGSLGNGMVIWYDNLQYLLGPAKSQRHYLKLMRINPMPVDKRPKAPKPPDMNAVVRMGYFWYGLTTTADESAVEGSIKLDTLWIFDSLNLRPIDIGNDTKRTATYFLDLSNADLKRHNDKVGVAKVLDGLGLPHETANDQQRGIIVRLTNHTLARLFKTNGNVETPAPADELIDPEVGPDNFYAADIYFNATPNQLNPLDQLKAEGYRSYGDSFKYFKNIEGKKTANIVGNSPWFDNQVLIGCPITFCYYGAVDAAAKIGDDIYFFHHYYWWSFQGEKPQLKSESAKLLSDFRVLGFNDRIKAPLDSVFTHEEKVYFVSDPFLYRSKNGVDLFVTFKALDIFPNLPEKIFHDPVDAVVVVKDRMFIFKADGYYVYNLVQEQMDRKYLSKFPFDLNLYPRPISDFSGYTVKDNPERKSKKRGSPIGIPKYIDAVMTVNDTTTMFFYGSFIYIAKKDKDDNTLGYINDVMLMQDYLDCDEGWYDYSKTMYQDRKSMRDRLWKFEPEMFEDDSKYTIKGILGIAAIFWAIAFAFLLLIVVIAQVYDYQLRQAKKRRYEQIKEKTKSHIQSKK